MSSSAQGDCETVITTNLALISQFQKSLSVQRVGKVGTDVVTEASDHPSPLLLLKAAVESVRATTTKLSLLSINVPFTPSAITSLVKPLNDSVLPSLVTATLLVTPSQYPDSFANENVRLVSSILTDLRSLVELVQKRATDGQPKREPNKAEKQSFTEATGRVWEACDSTINFSMGGVPGFAVKRVEQWLSLMKDAVEELQEWDPTEDVDDVFGGAFSDDGNDKFTDKKSDRNQATIAAGVKEQALKVLSRIPQSIHVVLKQRLAKMPADVVEFNNADARKHKATIEKIIHSARHISDCIDESAEAIYMGNPELCLKKAGEARAVTIDVVNLVLPPWKNSDAATEPSKEDTFVKRALVWIQQVDTTNITPTNTK